MLELAFPYFIALLPAPLAIWYLAPVWREPASALRVPFFQTVVDAAGITPDNGSVVKNRSRTELIISGLVWCLLVSALCKPQWVGEPITHTEAARDIMLAIDLSASMDYVDFADRQGQARKRLDAVKEVVDEFVAARVEDRIGLVVFGSKAFIQLPFTRDIDTARQLVELTEVGIAGPKTAIGDAIGLSIRHFESSDIAQRMLILLTDGNDTASQMTPINAAAIAANHAVQIYTIGVGDPNATGEDRVDFKSLEEIAERTGGQFFEASDSNALAAIYAKIDELVPAESKTQSWRPRQSLVHWPIGMAMLLIVLSSFLGTLPRQRIQKTGAAQ